MWVTSASFSVPTALSLWWTHGIPIPNPLNDGCPEALSSLPPHTSAHMSNDLCDKNLLFICPKGGWARSYGLCTSDWNNYYFPEGLSFSHSQQQQMRVSLSSQPHQLVMIWLSACCWYKALSYFCLHFSDYEWAQAPLDMPVGFFYKLPVCILCPFFSFGILSFLLICRNSLYILDQQFTKFEHKEGMMGNLYTLKK